MPGVGKASETCPFENEDGHGGPDAFPESEGLLRAAARRLGAGAGSGGQEIAAKSLPPVPGLPGGVTAGPVAVTRSSVDCPPAAGRRSDRCRDTEDRRRRDDMPARSPGIIRKQVFFQSPLQTGQIGM